MAKTYQKYKRKTRRAFPIPRADAPTEPTKYDPAVQVEGLEKRLEGSGIDPVEATDDRNFLEKALNLPEGQNFFFDVFETLGRPQQALFGGIKALQEGKNFSEGFSQGLSGDDYTNFGEIVRNVGIGDEDSFGLDDAIGFLGDVFLDPVDLAIIGASAALAAPTGGLSIPVGTKLFTAVNIGQDANKVLDAGKVILNLGEAASDVKKIGLGKKILNSFKATGKLYKDIGADILKGRVISAGKKLLKSKAVKLSDGTIITKISPTDITMKPFKAAFKFGGHAVRLTTKFGLAPVVAGVARKDLKSATDIIENALKAMEGWFNKGARMGSKILNQGQLFINKISGNRVYKEAFMKRSLLLLQDGGEKLYKIYKKTGQFADLADDALRKKAMEDFNKGVLEYGEIAYKPTTTRTEVLFNPNAASDPIDKAVRDQVAEMINNPVFADLKRTLNDSVASQRVYATLTNRIKRSTELALEDTIDVLNSRKAKLTDAADIKKIEGTINEYTNKLNALKARKITYKNYDEFTRIANDLLSDKNLNEQTLEALQEILRKNQDTITRNSFNIMDDLYERKFMDGKLVYVLRDGVDDTIKSIKSRISRVSNILSVEELSTLKLGRFTASGLNVGIEGKIRNFLKKANTGLELEDLFFLENNQWRVRDVEKLNEVVKIAELSKFGSEVIDSSSFRTREELEALKKKYADGFELQNEMDKILQVFEDGIQFIDDSYGTKFFNQNQKNEYIGHALTKEAKEAKLVRNKLKERFDVADTQERSFLVGNTQVYAGRKYRMSVADANRVHRFNKQRLLDAVNAGEMQLSEKALTMLKNNLNDNLFSEYFTDSMWETLTKLDGYGSAVRVMDEVLVGGWLADKDILRFGADTAEDRALNKGFRRVEKQTLVNKLNEMSKVYGDNSDMKKLVNTLLNKKEPFAYIDENVFDMIGRLADPKEIGTLTKIMKRTNDFFKTLKVFSAGFHFKNLSGNASNLYLAGVNARELAPLLVRGMSSTKGAKRLIDQFVASGKKLSDFMASLPPKKAELLRAYNIFLDAGFNDAASALYDIDEFVNKNVKIEGKTIVQKSKKGIPVLDDLLQANINLNQFVDNGYRLGYIQKLVKEGLTDDQIIRKVKSVLLDPSSLTAVEKNVIKNWIPFYTFAKKNLAFQMKNVFENPVQYKRFIRGVRSTWETAGIDWEEDLQDYQKENLWLPVPLTTKDGKYYQLKTSFPLSDLGEFLDNPAQKIIGSLTPLIRAPFEAAVNRQVFSQQPIERFKGEKGRDFGELGASARMEYALEQSGLDRLAAPVVNVVNLLQNRDAASILPTVTSQGDVETARTSKAYDRLDELRDLFKYYKQEEIPILTLSEIENINKQRANIAQRLAKLRRKTTRLLRRRAR